MLKQIADAIAQKDYSTAAKLIQELKQSDPRNPWLPYYIGLFYEETAKREKAEEIYRQVLRRVSNPKIIALARQGIERLEALVTETREDTLAEAISQPGGEKFGVLILKQIPSESKQQVAQKFAQVMQIDAYNARLQLPSRGWRLYRTGKMGELQYYTSALQAADIPCFCLPLDEIRPLNVYQVTAFEEIQPSVTVTCESSEKQEGNFAFEWSEVQQRVEGMLPLFEKVLDRDVKRKLKRKMQTLDYIPFCDLHLPSRKTILRFCDRTYNFKEGMSITPTPETAPLVGQTTTRKNWGHLMDFLNQNLPEVPIISDFTPFAETALGFEKMLKQIDPHIDLSRRYDTLWDAAFHLYSGLVFVTNLD